MHLPVGKGGNGNYIHCDSKPALILGNHKLERLALIFAKMFAMFDCACIEHAYRHLGAHTEEQATKDRIELLQKGGKFAKKALLGLTSQELFIRLSDDTTAIEWKTVGKS